MISFLTFYIGTFVTFYLIWCAIFFVLGFIGHFVTEATLSAKVRDVLLFIFSIPVLAGVVGADVAEETGRILKND